MTEQLKVGTGFTLTHNKKTGFSQFAKKAELKVRMDKDFPLKTALEHSYGLRIRVYRDDGKIETFQYFMNGINETEKLSSISSASKHKYDVSLGSEPYLFDSLSEITLLRLSKEDHEFVHIDVEVEILGPYKTPEMVENERKKKEQERFEMAEKAKAEELKNKQEFDLLKELLDD